MTRLALIGLHHETNTFGHTLVDQDWRASLHLGDRLVQRYGGSQSTVGGYLTVDETPGVEVVPVGFAEVTPSGPMTDETLMTLRDRLVEELAAAGRFDGVLLALHGALVTASHPEVDADIAEAVRRVVGDVPIGCVVDMHANVCQRLVDAVDLLAVYQTNPHVDPARRAKLVGSLVVEMARGRTRPAMAFVSVPLVVRIVRQDTSTEPMASILAFSRAAAERAGAVDVSVVEGFPYADVPHLGMSVLAVHDDPARARRLAEDIAAEVWRHREELQGEVPSIEDGLETVRRHPGPAPLLLLDIGDNIGGGAPGDSTVALAHVLKADLHDVVTTIVDPAVVAELAGVAPGTSVRVTLGAWSADHVGDPIELTATVTGHHQGTYTTAKIAHGGFKAFDPGAMVGLRTANGVAVVVTARAVQPVAAEQLTSVGLDPLAFRAVLAKGVNGPRAGYAEICSGVVELETPGVTRNDVAGFEYRLRRRPVFPFEPEATYPVQAPTP